MHDLNAIFEAITSNSCPNREEAKRDLSSAISMRSQVVIDNFISSWLLTSQDDLAKMTPQDKAYRQFIVDFKERCDGED